VLEFAEHHVPLGQDALRAQFLRMREAGGRTKDFDQPDLDGSDEGAAQQADRTVGRHREGVGGRGQTIPCEQQRNERGRRRRTPAADQRRDHNADGKSRKNQRVERAGEGEMEAHANGDADRAGDDDELRALEDFRFTHRMPSRAAAVRELLKRGLAAEGFAIGKPGARSRSFGVVGSVSDPERAKSG